MFLFFVHHYALIRLHTVDQSATNISLQARKQGHTHEHTCDICEVVGHAVDSDDIACHCSRPNGYDLNLEHGRKGD